jgi:hypothetical protein
MRTWHVLFDLAEVLGRAALQSRDGLQARGAALGRQTLSAQPGLCLGGRFAGQGARCSGGRVGHVWYEERLCV